MTWWTCAQIQVLDEIPFSFNDDIEETGVRLTPIIQLQYLEAIAFSSNA